MDTLEADDSVTVGGAAGVRAGAAGAAGVVVVGEGVVVAAGSVGGLKDKTKLRNIGFT